MLSTSYRRPLPVSLDHAAPVPVDEIGWASLALDNLYREIEGQLSYRRDAAAELKAAMMRVFLLSETLPHAAAEIAYRGTSQSLSKVCTAGKDIARRVGLDLRVDFPSMPDLDGWRCDPLPEFLGVGQEASEHEGINRARNWLDGLFDDARTAPHDLRVEIALLWHALPRAEIEQEYLGASPTIEKMRPAALALAKRLRTDLVDLDAEVAAQHKPMVA